MLQDLAAVFHKISEATNDNNVLTHLDDWSRRATQRRREQTQTLTASYQQTHITIDWLSMVCLHQHNIGYTADGFYRSDDPTNSVKALKEGG